MEKVVLESTNQVHTFDSMSKVSLFAIIFRISM